VQEVTQAIEERAEDYATKLVVQEVAADLCNQVIFAMEDKS